MGQRCNRTGGKGRDGGWQESPPRVTNRPDFRASAPLANVLGGCCSLGWGRAGPEKEREERLVFGGTAGRALAGGPTAARRTWGCASVLCRPPLPWLLWSPTPRPRCCFPATGRLARAPLGAAQGSWRVVKTSGRHRTELNLLGTGEKFTQDLKPPPSPPGSLGSTGGRFCLALRALHTSQ